MSCSNDNSSETPTIYTYTVSIQKTCPGGTQTTYTITKNAYESLSEQIVVNNVCQFVSFKDIHNKSYSGYIRSVTKTS